MGSKRSGGLFLIGMGIGLAFPALPNELNMIKNILWLILILAGIFMIIKEGD
jgi:high-affinity Fe2+/Pb2+ permease